MTTSRLAPLALLVALTLPACSTSPTEIVGGPLTFEGTLTSDALIEHFLSITTQGGVRIEALSIAADPPLAEGVSPTVGFGIGEPDAEGACVLTFSTNMAEGTNLAFGLEERDYCLRVFDNGSILEDSTRSYVIQVRASE